jgi:hypothetical protein
MPTPHKHAEVIKAWADGYTIQVLSPAGYWLDLPTLHSYPKWDADAYRVKPEPKPDIVHYGRLNAADNSGFQVREFSAWQKDTDNVKATFDGETGKLKSVEML